jgi:hypothetical protein
MRTLFIRRFGVLNCCQYKSKGGFCQAVFENQPVTLEKIIFSGFAEE